MPSTAHWMRVHGGGRGGVAAFGLLEAVECSGWFRTHMALLHYSQATKRKAFYHCAMRYCTSKNTVVPTKSMTKIWLSDCLQLNCATTSQLNDRFLRHFVISMSRAVHHANPEVAWMAHHLRSIFRITPPILRFLSFHELWHLLLLITPHSPF